MSEAVMGFLRADAIAKPRFGLSKKALLDTINRIKGSSKPSDAQSMDELSYVTMESKIHLRKGKWRRYSPEMEHRIIDGEKGH
jgi:hypothetical protein